MGRTARSDALAIPAGHQSANQSQIELFGDRLTEEWFAIEDRFVGYPKPPGLRPRTFYARRTRPMGYGGLGYGLIESSVYRALAE